MQLAGSQCCFCSRTVVLQAEATACVRCNSVAHKDCLQDAGNSCPACRTAWLNIADVVAYSQRCPSCGAVTSTVRLDRCSKCGSQTAWDTYTDYLVAKREIHSLGTRKAIGGSVGLLAGASLLGFVVAFLVQADHYHVESYEGMFGDLIMKGVAILVAIVLGAMAAALCRLGLRQLLSAIPMMRFF